LQRNLFSLIEAIIFFPLMQFHKFLHYIYDNIIYIFGQ